MNPMVVLHVKQTTSAVVSVFKERLDYALFFILKCPHTVFVLTENNFMVSFHQNKTSLCRCFTDAGGGERMFETGAVKSQDGAGRGSDGKGLAPAPLEEPQSEHQLDPALSLALSSHPA